MNLRFLYTLLLCTLCFFQLPGLTFAQELQGRPQAFSNTAPRQAPQPEENIGEGKKALDAYIEEAHNFQKSCDIDAHINLYYNCECLGARFLDSRIANPKLSQGEIYDSIKGKCLDASNAAGYYYQQCISSSPLVPSDKTTEKYCQCYGNSYAKLIEFYKGGNMTSKDFVAMQTEAHVSCSDPELAKRLYSYVPNP